MGDYAAFAAHQAHQQQAAGANHSHHQLLNHSHLMLNNTAVMGLTNPSNSNLSPTFFAQPQQSDSRKRNLSELEEPAEHKIGKSSIAIIDCPTDVCFTFWTFEGDPNHTTWPIDKKDQT